MAKYDPLRRFLRRRQGQDVLLTFDEIERIISGILPHAAKAKDWWDNTLSSARGRAQCYAWLEAGYHAEPCTPLDRVQFRFRSREQTAPSRAQVDQVFLDVAFGDEKDQEKVP